MLQEEHVQHIGIFVHNLGKEKHMIYCWLESSLEHFSFEVHFVISLGCSSHYPIHLNMAHRSFKLFISLTEISTQFLKASLVGVWWRQKGLIFRERTLIHMTSLTWHWQGSWGHRILEQFYFHTMLWPLKLPDLQKFKPKSLITTGYWAQKYRLLNLIVFYQNWISLRVLTFYFIVMEINLT